MALLLTPPVLGDQIQWRESLLKLIPDLDIRLWPDVGNPDDILYILVGRFNLNDLPELPNLRAIMPMFAGLEHLLFHPRCPSVPILRTGLPDGDKSMTEYTILHVLRHHRQMPDYLDQQSRAEWKVLDQKQPHEQRVGFMGFGQMAESPGRILSKMGFDVAAWVINERENDEIKFYIGAKSLNTFLARSDILVCLLPITNKTRGIINSKTLQRLPKGASFINLGRGEHIVEADLIQSLDSGHLSNATLDATIQEPLPKNSPLWNHPKITIMPHVARRVRPENVGIQVAENIRRDRLGLPFLWEVDREAGY